MPRKRSGNTEAVSFRIPPEWNACADELAERESGEVVRVTRTEMLRHALKVGLDQLVLDRLGSARRKKVGKS
jgi:hypothetical protein